MTEERTGLDCIHCDSHGCLTEFGGWVAMCVTHRLPFEWRVVAVGEGERPVSVRADRRCPRVPGRFDYLGRFRRG
jgi:hypothetical protein